MKKIGTISASAGLIYLGTWMIINKINPELGTNIFKWWPIIIVILGLEVLIQFSRRGGENIGFNFLVIPVLILLLIANIFNGVKTNFFKWIDDWNIISENSIRIGDIEFNDSKPVNTSKTIPVHGNVIYIHTNNASLDVKKSEGGDIRIEGKVYVDDDSFVNKYDIAEKKEDSGYSIEIMDSFINGIKFDVYIPDGYNIKILTDNLDIRSNDGLEKSSFNIEADNANVKISEAKSIVINYRNANINIDDIENVDIKGDNGNINVRGESENIKIEADKGKIYVNNEVCRDVTVDLNQGVASVRTDDDDVDVNVEISQGVSGINNDKGVNKGMKKTFGSGSGKVQIRVQQGTASFRN